MSFAQNDEERNKKLINQFVVGMEYGIKIKPEKMTSIRLTKAKTSMFSYGFNFTSGQAQYPTFIMVNSTDFKNGFFYIRGKLRDNDDPYYRLSMETENNKSKLKCGYNKVGDDVELIFQQLIRESKGDHFMQYEGKMKVIRDSQSYFVQPTQYEANPYILDNSKPIKELIFDVDTFGTEIYHKQLQKNYILSQFLQFKNIINQMNYQQIILNI